MKKYTEKDIENFILRNWPIRNIAGFTGWRPNKIKKIAYKYCRISINSITSDWQLSDELLKRS